MVTKDVENLLVEQNFSPKSADNQDFLQYVNHADQARDGWRANKTSSTRFDVERRAIEINLGPKNPSFPQTHNFTSLFSNQL